MSSDLAPLTRRAAILGLLALAGCGFTPVYGTGGVGGKLRGAVQITAPQTVEGYRLAHRIEDRLGRATSPRYALTVTLDITSAPVAIDRTDTSTRINLPGTANWTLTDTAGVRLGTGTVDTFTGYSTTGTTVATRAAQQDARDRLATALADLVVTRLMILAPDLPE